MNGAATDLIWLRQEWITPARPKHGNRRSSCGLLCDIPFGTLYGQFARWTRSARGAGCLTGNPTWRRTFGDSPEPSAVVIDSQSRPRRRWRSTSRRRTGMTPKASCRCGKSASSGTACMRKPFKISLSNCPSIGPPGIRLIYNQAWFSAESTPLDKREVGGSNSVPAHHRSWRKAGHRSRL
jgi:hypothetical protein